MFTTNVKNCYKVPSKFDNKKIKRAVLYHIIFRKLAVKILKYDTLLQV